jgi:organic radical activating enzyme
VNKTIISQVIPTIQGEGPSVGTPVLLIRTGNCNLECSFCDTKWSNNMKLKDVKKFTKKNRKLPFIVEEDTIDDFINYINNDFLNKFTISTVLITGGEPLMNKEFVGSLIYNKNTNLKNITKIEIETNGVLLNDPKDYLIFFHWDKQIQLNISPKLDPEYYRSEKIKTIDDIISLFDDNRIKSFEKILDDTPTIIDWKFVYSKSAEAAIDSFITQVRGVNSINIMPLTPDYTKYKSEIKFLEDFRKSTYDALDYCMRKGYVLSPRIHVWVFNNFKHRDEFIDVRKL